MRDNPWNRLPDTAPFVLPEDKERVESFNRRQEHRAGGKHSLYLGLIPEAFIGSREAPLVLLGNVSGLSETGDGPAAYRLKPAFMERMRSNLLNDGAHRDSQYPFVYFDPAINPVGAGGSDWWDRRLKHIIALFGTPDVAKPFLAKKILAVEFSPYVSSSNRFAFDGLKLPSQQYSFDLVRDAVKRRAVIVVRFGERRWLAAVPELEGYDRFVRRNNYLKGVISRNSCIGNGWSLIQAAVGSCLPNQAVE
jgi:hypothetical protein